MSGINHRVTVVGLGPAGPELISGEVRAILGSGLRTYVRTTRHPAAEMIHWTASFDHLYDGREDVGEVYAAIVDALVGAADEHGCVVYAVPGSPLVAERSVELLRSDPRIRSEIHPAMSFLDLAWDRLGIDPISAGVRLVDGTDFAVQAAGQTGPLLVAQCWSRSILSDVRLAFEERETTEGPVATTVAVLKHLGLSSESVLEVPWNDLERLVEPDHLTTLFIPELASPAAAELVRLQELVRTLRGRCPWDREQTHASLTRHLVEETYEVLEAIEELDGTPASFGHLEEELGDLLFQVYFHSTLAAEEGQFGLADVARRSYEKLVRRHPHVFGEVHAATPDAVMANWEQLKKEEKGRASLMEGVPRSLPALLQALKLQRKAASVGIDPTSTWPGNANLSDAVGDLLFAVVGLSRQLAVDPESALRRSCAAFRRRFEEMEHQTGCKE